MVHRQLILGSLTRRRLLELASVFDITGLGGARKPDIILILTRQRRASTEQMLTELYRDELKAICKRAELDTSGQANQLLIDRILGRELPAGCVNAVDLFCGVGGLTYGLAQAGLRVEAGIDIDHYAKFAYCENNRDTRFFDWDLSCTQSSSIDKLFGEGTYRLLAGCAPCQPFSKLTNGRKRHHAWGLLDSFGQIVREITPELITMENVPELAKRGREVFNRFLRTLDEAGYESDWRVVNCADYGVPQQRKRLVLLASRLGPISVPRGTYRNPQQHKRVRETIGGLPALKAGEADPNDPLHVAPLLSSKNMKRIRATPHDGGTRRDWPESLVLDCHRKASGERYGSIYGRMWWDRPAPTMTTLCTGIGNGRFGHPEQDRSITLREAALFQSFPISYRFCRPDTRLNRGAVSRLIGNAVPPRLAEALGKAVLNHVQRHGVG